MTENTEYDLLRRTLSILFEEKRASDLADTLIERFGTLNSLINSMSLPETASSIPESVRSLLAFIPHIHRIRTLEQMGPHPMLNSLERTQKYVSALYAGVQYEQLCMLCLDRDLRLLECCRINQGNLKEVPFYPRRLLQEALTRRTRAIILCHNHPGNWGFFSEPDVAATQELMELCRQNHIALLDHLLIARERISSLRCRIYIPEKLWRADPLVPPLAQWRTSAKA